ncbi:MAG TPA: hypothetical protein VIV66_04910 [Pyrinomonadaceae bacterium]
MTLLVYCISDTVPMRLWRILLIAIGLGAAKLLTFFLAAHRLPDSDLLNAVFAIAALLLIWPEMMVSYEQGPHGLPARVVMFTAGTVVNFGLLAIITGIWRIWRANHPNRETPLSVNVQQ